MKHTYKRSSRKRYRKTIKQIGGQEYKLIQDSDRFSILQYNNPLIYDNKLNRSYLFNNAPIQTILNTITHEIISLPLYVIIDMVNNEYYAINNESTPIQSDSIASNYIENNLNITTSILQLKRKGIHIKFIVKGCENPDDVPSIQQIVQQLNNKLQKKCNALSIHVERYHKMKGELTLYTIKNEWIICLYHNEKCISSIVLHYIDDIFEIMIETHKEYNGKKYMKLLLAAAVIICNIFICNGKKINKIKAYIANPITAWILIDNFMVEVNDWQHKNTLSNQNNKKYTTLFLIVINLPN